MSKFYHLVKTHKIPSTLSDPTEWLEEHGIPIRGIISRCGSATERLAGYVDFVLQPGMQNLPTFLRDSIHTLQIIEETNDEIRSGEISLEGVGLVSLDLESMYNNMSRQLGTAACKEYLESNQFPEGWTDEFLPSTNSI